MAMQNLPDDDEEDTAFGRLGPRAGPGAMSRPPRARPMRRWAWAAIALVIAVLAVLYLGGRA